MKRSVAVLGATPAFIRWAVEYSCDLRDVDVPNLADGTFRQLRSLRELSAGIEEGRVIDGFCLSADTASSDSSAITGALGFPTDEVFDVFGDAGSISASCHHCPANSALPEVPLVGHQTRWAGCFGWLATDLNYSFDPSVKLVTNARPNLIARINEICRRDSLAADFGGPTKSQPFYSFWQHRWLEPDVLEPMTRVFELAAREVQSHQELTLFAAACRRAVESQLRMFVELVPRGFSDGIHWRRNPSCMRCGLDVAPDEERSHLCPGCGTDSPVGNSRKSKVLGRRPYLQLEKILSTTGTEELLTRYRDGRS